MSEGDNESELHARLAREAEFHDVKYSEAGHYPKHYSVSPTAYIYEAMLQRLGDIKGRDVLEYGCGDGWVTKDLVGLGANLSAFDVSPTAVSETNALLGRLGYRENYRLDVMPAEKLAYPSGSFDVAFGFAILHHLDLPRALPELLRVLKPGGVGLFAEPLGTNPLIEFYRRLTPQYRTADERPMVLREFPDLFSGFSSIEHEEYYLTALAAVGVVYLPGGAPLFGPLNRFLSKIDRSLLQKFPSLGKFAWYSIISIRK